MRGLYSYAFVHIIELSFKCNVNSSCTSGGGGCKCIPPSGGGEADTMNVF